MVVPKKLGFFLAIVVLFVIAIVVGLYVVFRYPQDIQLLGGKNYVTQDVQPTPAKNAVTTLFVDTDNASVSANKLEIPIAIDTGENTVSVVELHFTYDANLLTGVAVEPGNFFTNPTVIEKTVDAAAGTIRITTGSLKPRQGIGSIVTITGILKQKTSVTIHIVPKTRVAAIGELGSVLNSTRDGTVQVP